LPELVPPDEKTRHERLRIARDLHDTVSQRLAAVGFSLDATIADEAVPAAQKKTLREIRLELTEVIKELRDEILALRDDQASSVEDWLKERLSIDLIWRENSQSSPLIHSESEIRYLLLELLQNAIRYRNLTSSLIEITTYSIDVTFLTFDAIANQSDPETNQGRTPLGRLGVHERIKSLSLSLVEREAGFTLQW
jgi:signal transduction histidine kinase